MLHPEWAQRPPPLLRAPSTCTAPLPQRSKHISCPIPHLHFLEDTIFQLANTKEFCIWTESITNLTLVTVMNGDILYKYESCWAQLSWGTSSAASLCSPGYRWRLRLFTSFQQCSPSEQSKWKHTWMKNASLAVPAFLTRKEPFSDRKASLSLLHGTGGHPCSGCDLARCQQSWPCSRPRPASLHTLSAKLALAPVSCFSLGFMQDEALENTSEKQLDHCCVRVSMRGRLRRCRPWVHIRHCSVASRSWVRKNL